MSHKGGYARLRRAMATCGALLGMIPGYPLAFARVIRATETSVARSGCRQSELLARHGIKPPPDMTVRQSIVDVPLGHLETFRKSRRLVIEAGPIFVEQLPYELAAAVVVLLNR